MGTYMREMRKRRKMWRHDRSSFEDIKRGGREREIVKIG